MTPPDTTAALRAALSIPTPRQSPECSCAECYERRHADAERQTWRDLDDARRTADQLRKVKP